jgi:hypothetical protein
LAKAHDDDLILRAYAITPNAAAVARLLGIGERTVRRKLDRPANQKKLASIRARFEKEGYPSIEEVASTTQAPARVAADPLEEAKRSLERSRAFQQERELLYAVAGERSLRETLTKLMHETAKVFPAPPAYVPPRRPSAVTEVGLLHLSDWHAYEEVKKSRTQGLNDYNAEVFARRVRRIIDQVIARKQRMEGGGVWHIPELVIACNGDFVSGTIHDAERHLDAPNVVMSVYGCGMTLAAAIRDLAPHFSRITAMCTSGNHGRLGDQRKTHPKDPTRNWDTLIYLFAETALRDCKNVRFVIPDSYVVSYNIGSKRFVQYHGHAIKCFPPDTLVQADWASWKPIGDFAEGDLVLNGRGSTSSVTGVHRYPYDGKLVSVQVANLPKDAFRCTPTHKVRCLKPHWVVEGEKVPEPEWVPAKLLSVGDYMAIPRPRLTCDLHAVSTACLDGEQPDHFNDKTLPDYLPADAEFGEVLGMFAGDGSVSAQHQIEVALGLDEHEWVEQYRDQVERLVGERPSILNDPDKNVYRVMLYHKRFGRVLKRLAPGLSGVRSLHQDVFRMPREALRGVLRGWLKADGHGYHREGKYTYLFGDSVSRTLAWQMFWIAAALGYKPGLRRTYVRKAGKYGKWKYRVTFYGNEAAALGLETRVKMRDKRPPKLPSERICYLTDEFYFLPITKVEQVPYKGEVVDLSVAEDSSFIVGGCSVHNSWNQIPHYGIGRWTRNNQAMRSLTNSPVDYYLMGHFHSDSSLPSPRGKTFINGSLIGGTEYAVEELGACDAPMQRFFTVSDPVGITDEVPIFGEIPGEDYPHTYPVYPWERADAAAAG